MTFIAPPANCPLCPRLVAFREENQKKFPHFYNGAVPPFGPLDAQLLVVGLAPGLKGANATGRPFTGDFAGDILYASLKTFGFARGEFKKRADDGFELVNARVSNAVRCVPPENKPTPAEAKTCNQFLVSEIAAMKHLKIILSLGLTSHQAVLKTLKLKQGAYKFGHGAVHELVVSRESLVFSGSKLTTQDSRLLLIDSYHTSRYNVQTGRLTQAMFDDVVKMIAALI